MFNSHVMKLLVPVPTVVEAMPVTLCLHKQVFHFVLTLVSLLEPSSNVVVFNCATEIVQS